MLQPDHGGLREVSVRISHPRIRSVYWLLTKCEVKMAGYWPSSVFACLWTRRSRDPKIRRAKKKEANIQPF